MVHCVHVRSERSFVLVLERAKLGGFDFADRFEEDFVLKGLQDSARGFNPGNTFKKCPALKGR